MTEMPGLITGRNAVNPGAQSLRLTVVGKNILTITGFATTYLILGHVVGPPLSPLGAFVFSVTSFHGRGFFQVVLD